MAVLEGLGATCSRTNPNGLDGVMRGEGATRMDPFSHGHQTLAARTAFRAGSLRGDLLRDETAPLAMPAGWSLGRRMASLDVCAPWPHDERGPFGEYGDASGRAPHDALCATRPVRDETVRDQTTSGPMTSHQTTSDEVAMDIDIRRTAVPGCWSPTVHQDERKNLLCRSRAGRVAHGNEGMGEPWMAV